MSIFITSDFHFNHDRDFVWLARGYKSVEEMNNTIIENYNSFVSNDDDVYILGDLILGGADKLQEGINLISQLNGRLHLVRGNHDTDMRWESYKSLSNVVEMENSIYLNYNHYHFYLSHFPCITSNHDYNKPLKQRTLNICGHTHTKDRWCDADKGYIYHAEIDAHPQNQIPILIDLIIEEFKAKFQQNSKLDQKIKQVDTWLFTNCVCGSCKNEGQCASVDWTFNQEKHILSCRRYDKK